MLGDQLRFELAVSVTRDLDFDFGVVGLDFLSGRTVAGVAAVAPRGVVLLIAEQVSQFAIEGAFNECLAEIFEEVFNLSGGLAAGEQLIDKLRIEFGCLLFWLNGHGSESFLKYGCLLHFVRLHKLSDTLKKWPVSQRKRKNNCLILLQQPCFHD